MLGRLTPVAVSGLTGVVEFVRSRAGSHGGARVQDGTVRCWGSNSYGELGDGTTTTRLSPVTVLW